MKKLLLIILFAILIILISSIIIYHNKKDNLNYNIKEVNFSPKGDQALIISELNNDIIITSYKNNSFHEIYKIKTIDPYISNILWSQNSAKALILCNIDHRDNQIDNLIMVYENNKITCLNITIKALIYTGGWSSNNTLILAGNELCSYNNNILESHKFFRNKAINNIRWNPNHTQALLFGEYNDIIEYSEFNNTFKSIIPKPDIGQISDVEWINNKEALIIQVPGKVYKYSNNLLSNITVIRPTNEGSNIITIDFYWNNFSHIGMIVGYEDYNVNGWGNVEKTVLILNSNNTFNDIDNNNYSFIAMNWIPNTQDAYLLNYDGLWKYHNNKVECIKDCKGLYLISISNIDHSILISGGDQLYYYKDGLFIDLKESFQSSIR